MRRYLPLAALVLVGLVGCSSKPAASTGSETPSETPTNSASSGSDASAFLQNFRKGFTDQKFRAAYTISSGGQTFDLTVAQDPPKQSYKIVQGGQTTFVIQDGGNTILCTAAGAPCSKSAGTANLGFAQAFLAPILAFRDSIASATDLPGFASKGSQTVAGRAATCASWSYGGGTVDVCSDNETGVLLSWSEAATVNGQTSQVSWTANSFGAPADADFTPTGPVS